MTVEIKITEKQIIKIIATNYNNLPDTAEMVHIASYVCRHLFRSLYVC